MVYRYIIYLYILTNFSTLLGRKIVNFSRGKYKMFIQGIVYYVFGIIGFANGVIDSFKYMNKSDDETDNRYLKRTCPLIKYRNKEDLSSNITVNQKLRGLGPLSIYIISGTIYSLTYLSIPFLSNRIIDHFIK